MFLPTFRDCVTIIGLGGVGGSAALQIGRLLPLFDVQRLVLYDPDVVEDRNLEGQVYSQSDIGDEDNPKAKVTGIQRRLDDLPQGECRIEYHREYVDETTPLRGVVIVAVDSLKARQDVFRALHYTSGRGNKVPLLIEARVGDNSNYGLIYVLDPNDPAQMKEYGKTLFWEEENDAPLNDLCVPADLGAVFGGVIARLLRKFWEEYWSPSEMKIGFIDFGTFPMVQFP